MCGILGFASASGDPWPDAHALRRGLRSLARRGPDDEGVWDDGRAVLGHRRLSVLDLSTAGHQPMISGDGRYVLAYNGELYNFRELRQGLERQGVSFRSNSDTEVILELYARLGSDALEQMRGMFALAIWDTLQHELLLARDRLGIKPLYVWQGPACIAFASELKALRAVVPRSLSVNERAVFAFLTWGSVPAPLTMLKDVRSLGAGTWLHWRPIGSTERQFWSIPAGPVWYSRRGEALEALRPALRSAVALRCIADVPIGAFLSGGIDSSALVSLMRDANQRDLRTFAVTFPGTDLDESGYAASVAKAFDTRHTAIPATPELVRDALEDFFEVMDQPTGDGLNVYLVSCLAKEAGLTVALSGIGGDELFGGYPTFRRARFAEQWLTRTSPQVRQAAAALMPHLSPRLAKFEAFALSGHLQAQAYFLSRGLFAPSQARALLSKDWRANANLSTDVLPALEDGLDSFHATMKLELSHYMHNQLLRDADVFGMGHALEIRVPLIDHEVVEIVARTHRDVVMAGGQKALLRDALGAPLPRSIAERPKMGFTFPFEQWVRTNWCDSIGAKLSRPSAVLALEPRKRIWSDFLSGRVHWSRPWSLYVLMTWLDRHLA